MVSSASVSKADVLVVGGGPAGAVAALNLAPFHEVLVVEGRARPSARVGESLAPAARRLLSDMGLWEAFLAQGHAPCHGNRSVWGSEEVVANSALRDPDGPGWHLDRARFEEWLRAVAQERGARFLSPARLVDARDEGEGWRVAVEFESDRYEIDCAFVIDGTGRAASFARRQGAVREALDRLACGWVHGRDEAVGVARTTFVEAVEDGWWYTAPLPDRRRVLAFHTDADLPSSRTLQNVGALLEGVGRGAHLAGLLSQAGFVPGSDGGVLAASGSRLRPGCGERWLAVGDAAMTFDPLASQGLLNALYTGLAGAEQVYRCLAGEAASPDQYAATLDRVGTAYADHLAAWYRLEGRWPDHEFWRRRHRLLSRS